MTLHLLLAWAAAGAAFSCPWCRIENHFHTAVPSAEHIAVVKVLEKSSERQWRATVQEVINGKVGVGQTREYEDRFQVGRPGEVMLAIGISMSGEAASNDLLSLDLLPEIQRLLQPDSQPANADEAAEYLTSVSFVLHSAGASYYKARPAEVQEALVRRIRHLEAKAALPTSPYYVGQQVRCGLMALLRIRTPLSDEQVVREIEAFRQVSSQPYYPEKIPPAMERLETVFSVLAENPRDDRRNLAIALLASAQGKELSRVSQCLIISKLLSPEAIMHNRSDDTGIAWVRDGIVQAGIRHLNSWDSETAAKLAQTAREIPDGRSSGDSELTSLRNALEKKEHHIPSSGTRPRETPDDAGWYSWSPVFDKASWEKLPVRAPAESFMSLEIIILGVAAAFLLLLFAGLLRKFRAAEHG